MKQRINPIFLMNRAAHKIAQRIGPSTYLRSSGGALNLANDYVKDLNNWALAANVTYDKGTYYGRNNVWSTKNLATSGVSAVYDYAANELAGGPILEVGVSYIFDVDIYTPSTNVRVQAGAWYTTDTSATLDRSYSAADDLWNRVSTTMVFAVTKDSILNAGSISGISVGDQAVFDMNTLVIRKG